MISRYLLIFLLPYGFLFLLLVLSWFAVRRIPLQAKSLQILFGFFILFVFSIYIFIEDKVYEPYVMENHTTTSQGLIIGASEQFDTLGVSKNVGDYITAKEYKKLQKLAEFRIGEELTFESGENRVVEVTGGKGNRYRLIPILTDPDDFEELSNILQAGKKLPVKKSLIKILPVIDHLNKSFVVIPILIFAFLFHSLVNFFLWEGLFVDENNEPMVPKLLRQLTAGFIFISSITIAVAVIYPTFLTTFLTTIGTSGAIAAFLAQQPIRQAFTALSLNLNKTIRPNHLIEIDGKVGLVKEIGWKSIKMETRDKTQLSVPNTILVNSIYTNQTILHGHRLIDFQVYTKASSSPALVREVLRKCVNDSDMVKDEPQITLSKILTTRCLYTIEVPTDVFDMEEVKGEILTSIWYALRRERLHPRHEMEPVENPVERAKELLNKVEILAPLSNWQDQLLSQKAEWLRYGWPEKIIVEGGTDAALFIVAEGSVDVLVRQEDGSDLKITEISSDSDPIFGEMSLLTGEPRTATIRAREDVLVCKISKASIHPMLRSKPAVLKELSHKLAVRQMEIQQKEEDYAEKLAKKHEDGLADKFLQRISDFFQVDVDSKEEEANAHVPSANHDTNKANNSEENNT